jgi:hypothetical protein
MDGRILLLFRVRSIKLGLVDATNLLRSVMSQVFVVVAAGSVLSFIIRELGQPAIASWIIQVRWLWLECVVWILTLIRVLCSCNRSSLLLSVACQMS